VPRGSTPTAMQYRQYGASPGLGHIVECFWTLRTAAGAPAAIDRVLPDGRCEVILHAGVPFSAIDQTGARSVQERVLFAGQCVRAVRLLRPPGAHVVAARLRPGAVFALTGVPAGHLAGRVQDLAAVDARLAVALSGIAGEDDETRTVRALDAALLKHVAGRAVDPVAAGLVGAAVASGGRMRVDDMVRLSGAGGRRVERLFAKNVGLAPKTFLRILRFQRVLAALRAGDNRSFAALAHEGGFYDQAHLINDFRSFAGATPSAWPGDGATLMSLLAGRG